MKLSERLAAEKEFVERELHGLTICDRCKATLPTYGKLCTADLSESCPGFERIEAAREKYAKATEGGTE